MFTHFRLAKFAMTVRVQTLLLAALAVLELFTHPRERPVRQGLLVVRTMGVVALGSWKTASAMLPMGAYLCLHQNILLNLFLPLSSVFLS
jgi:hypothetical protein